MVWLWAAVSVGLSAYGDSAGHDVIRGIGIASFLAAFAVFAYLVTFKYMPDWLGTGWWRKRR